MGLAWLLILLQCAQKREAQPDGRPLLLDLPLMDPNLAHVFGVAGRPRLVQVALIDAPVHKSGEENDGAALSGLYLHRQALEARAAALRWVVEVDEDLRCQGWVGACVAVWRAYEVSSKLEEWRRASGSYRMPPCPKRHY